MLHTPLTPFTLQIFARRRHFSRQDTIIAATGAVKLRLVIICLVSGIPGGASIRLNRLLGEITGFHLLERFDNEHIFGFYPV